MIIIGIDLAGKEENPTGICVTGTDKVILKTLHSDTDIIKYVKKINPSIVTIDAPLSLPKGRCCLEKDCKCASGGHLRKAEREIRPYGRVLPLTFKGMKMLTLRGIRLAQELRKDFEVIETHPRTIQKMLGFKDLKDDLSKVYKLSNNPTEHELDALLAAMIGNLYINGLYLELGDPEEGTIILPLL
ncbi:MAG: DUF429 domain-containing protein [Methanobacterium sp.]|nr:DUF429 domain-containing protein [Methanobacterium sp.]